MKDCSLTTLRQLARQSLLTFIEILETQTSYKIPVGFYCCALGLYFLQALSNIIEFSDSKNYEMKTFGLVANISSLTYLIRISESTTRLWVFYILSHVLLYSVVIYILRLTYLRQYQPQQYASKSAITTTIREFINTFLALFVVFLFEPYIKINIGIMVQGHRTLIFEYQNNPVSISTVYFFLLGLLGCIITFLIATLVIYFFRNFEYNDANCFKRKYSYVFFLNLLIRFMMAIINSIQYDFQKEAYQHVLANFLSLFTLYDALAVRPFLNQTLSKAYILLAMMYSIIVFFNTILIFTEQIQPDMVMYSFIWLSPLLSEIALNGYDVYYQESLRLLPENLSVEYELFDLYSEEILRLYLDSKSNDQSKFLVHQLFRLHILSCKSPECFCLQFGSDNQQKIAKEERFKGRVMVLPSRVNERAIKHISLSMKILVKLVDSMFKIALENESVLNDLRVYENLSLKYISFVQKYMENSLLSTFFLKKLANNQKQLSFFFSLLFEVYSDKLKYSMKLINESLQSSRTDNRNNDGLKYFTEGIQTIEDFTKDFIQELMKVLNLKFKIWQQIVINSNSMDDLLGRIYKEVRGIISIRLQLIQSFKSRFDTDQGQSLASNAAYNKLQQIFQLFIMNEISEVKRMESKIIDLKKRDQYKEEIFLNNHNYMNGNSVIIQAGISLENGKILNRDNTKIPTFFGYDQTDWDRITTINDLMPQHISILHNQILAQYLSKGYSSLMTTARKIFLLNKENYLFPVSISVRNDFQILNDCVFNVTLLRVSSNKELIMFDEYGRIIGFSQHLYNIMSADRFTEKRIIDYDFIRSRGFFYLLFPNFLKVFESLRSELEQAEKAEDVVALPLLNLQCSLILPSDFKDLTESYEDYRGQKRRSKLNKEQLGSNMKNSLSSEHSKSTQLQTLPSLLNVKDCQFIQKFIQKHKYHYASENVAQRLRLKFTLHAFYRSFANIDGRVLKSITGNNKTINLMHTMRYYVVECSEMFRIKQKHHQVYATNFSTTIAQTNTKGRPSNRNLDKTPKSFDGSGDSKQIPYGISFDDGFKTDKTNQTLFDPEAEFDYLSEISEKKDGIEIKGVDPVVDSFEGFNNDDNTIQNAYQGECASPRSDIDQSQIDHIMSIDSPKASQRNFLAQADTLDNKKKNFLMNMFKFEQKHERQPPIMDNLNQFSKVGKEYWPESLEEIDFFKSSKLVPLEKESNLKFTKSLQEKELVDGSYIADSDDGEQEDDDHLSQNKKIPKAQKNQEVNEKRQQFDMDISSQNSKLAVNSFPKVNELFLEHRMPKKYSQFLLAVFILMLTITVCLIIQVTISSLGFQSIDYFNQYVDTAFAIQSSLIKGTLGATLLDLESENRLPHNFKMYFNETNLYTEYLTQGTSSLISIQQQRFDLLRSSQSTLEGLNVDIITFYDQAIEHLNSLKKLDKKEDLTLLIEKMPLSLRITYKLDEMIKSQLYKLESDLVNNFFLIFYAALVLILFQVIIMIITYQSFLKFQEKIVLLVTRVNLDEFDRETQRIDCSRQYLKDLKGSQIITTDFIPSLLYFNQGRNRSMPSMEHLAQVKTSTRIAKPRKQINTKDGNNNQAKTQLLSSKIYNPTLSIRFQLLQYLAVALLVIFYLVGAIIFTLQIPSKYSTLSGYYLGYSDTFSNIQQLILFTEVKVQYPYLMPQPKLLGFDSYVQFEDYFSYLMSSFQTFTRQEQMFKQSDQNLPQILNLLYGDLCQQNTTEHFNYSFLQDACQSSLATFYKKGVSGIISSLNYLLTSYSETLDTVRQTQKEELNDFIQLKDHWALVILFPKTTGLAIQNVLYLIQNQLSELTTSLGDSLLIYLLITGIFIVMLLFLYFYFHIRDINERIESVEFLLSLIPYEKLQEPTINQMLKQIQIF